jgi:uncharacterized protein YjiS (DUF1127 family)
MRLATLWKTYRRRAAEREAIRRLSSLSDSMLRDIGIDRAGLREAVHAGRGR